MHEYVKLCLNEHIPHRCFITNYQENCVLDHTTQALKMGHTCGVYAEVQSSEDIHNSTNTHRYI